MSTINWVFAAFVVATVVSLVIAFVSLMRAPAFKMLGGVWSRWQRILVKHGMMPSNPVGRSFRAGMKKLRSMVSKKDYLHIPIVMVIGPSKSGKNSMLKSVCQNNPVDVVNTDSEPCQWWFFDKALVLDVRGDLILDANGNSKIEDWRLLLNLLSNARSYPIDSITLSIDCRDFEDAEENDRWDGIFRSLYTAQYVLGFKIPIYIVLTHCDSLPGFSALYRAITPDLFGDIFGWSNPYSLDIPFQTAWIASMIADLNDRITTVISEIIAEDINIDESLFCLMHSLSQMSERLSTGLHRIFHSDKYHEGFILRGIYFCGQDVGGNIAFARDLFEKKIFVEKNLAMPTKWREFLGGKQFARVQWAVIIFLMVWTFGLYHSYHRMQNLQSHSVPCLDEIHKLMFELDDKSADTHSNASTAILSKIFEQLTKMGIVMDNWGKPWSIWIPYSWFSEVKDKFDDFLVEVYTRAVIPDLFSHVHRKINAVANESIPDDEGESRSEFRKMQDYITKLNSSERIMSKFSSLFIDADMADFSDVVWYAIGVKLPDHFMRRCEHFLKKAVYRSIVPSFPMEEWKKDSTATFKKIYQDFSNKGHALEDMLDGLSSYFDNITSAIHKPNYDDLLKITQMMYQISEQLQSREYGWHFYGDLVTKSLQNLLSSVESSPLIDREVIRSMEEDALKKFHTAQKSLLTRGSGICGIFLVLKNGRLNISEQLFSVQSMLNLMTSAGFMQHSEGEVRPTPPGEMLMWNPIELKRAVKILRDYENFISTELLHFPEGMQSWVQEIAKHRAQQRVRHFIAKGQHFVPALPGGAEGEEQIIQATQNLILCRDSLDILSARLDSTIFAPFFSSLRQQGLDLLGRVRSESMKYSFYDTGYVQGQWLNGSLMTFLFNVYSREELKRYIDKQRKHIMRLGISLSDPVINMMKNLPKPYADLSMFNGWVLAVADMKSYQAGNQNSSLAQIERYVETKIPEMKPGVCKPELMQNIVGLNDIASSEQRLRDKVYKLCSGSIVRDFMSKYEPISTYFNKHLAGRFPFSDSKARVDLGKIKGFYEKFGDGSALLSMARSFLKDSMEEVFKKKDNTNFIKDVVSFASSLVKAKPIFDDLISKKTVSVSLTFRTHRKNEVNADQIISWTTKIGDMTMDFHQKPPMIKWRYGDAISVDWRFADRSSLIPVSANDFQADGRHVSWESTDPWSLFRLIQKYGRWNPSDKSFRLRFIIPVTGWEEVQNPVVVFARIALMHKGVDGMEKVGWNALPSKAPTMDVGDR